MICFGMAVKWFGGIRSKCEDDKGTDNEDGDSDTDR